MLLTLAERQPADLPVLGCHGFAWGLGIMLLQLARQDANLQAFKGSLGEVGGITRVW